VKKEKEKNKKKMQKNKQSFMPKLIFLCCITTSIVTTLSMSKYESTVVGISSATVAKFDVRMEVSQNTELQLDYTNTEKQTASYSFSVIGESEVTVLYDVIVELPDDWPLTVSMKLFQKIGDKEVEMQLASKNGNIYTWTNTFEISEGETKHDYVLQFSFDSAVDNNRTLEGIKILVNAQQEN